MPAKARPPRDLDAAIRAIALEDLPKTARINFLVSPAEKSEIQETATSFGLTTTDYLLRLHRLTRSMLDGQRSRAAKRGRR
jgi:hypothetical protein